MLAATQGCPAEGGGVRLGRSSENRKSLKVHLHQLNGRLTLVASPWQTVASPWRPFVATHGRRGEEIHSDWCGLLSGATAPACNERLLDRDFIKEDWLFCLTRAIIRTMIGPCYTPLSLAPMVAGVRETTAGDVDFSWLMVVGDVGGMLNPEPYR